MGKAVKPNEKLNVLEPGLPMELNYTFLMCVHKLTPFVGEAVASVLGQTDPDFEFIIVANNCGEDLWCFLNEFDDRRIQLYRTRIGQLSFNLNYGLNLAKEGDILRIDADDIALLYILMKG